MSGGTRAYVVDLLESYPKRMQEIALLHYELEHPAHISTNEMISAMSFSHGDGVVRSSGHVSNKTLYIALNYQDKTEKINADTTEEIVKRLVSMEHEQERLAYYVSLLDQQQKTAINRFYFEGISWEKIAQELQVAVRTIYKIKRRALDRLADLYELAGIPGAIGQSADMLE